MTDDVIQVKYSSSINLSCSTDTGMTLVGYLQGGGPADNILKINCLRSSGSALDVLPINIRPLHSNIHTESQSCFTEDIQKQTVLSGKKQNKH